MPRQPIVQVVVNAPPPRRVRIPAVVIRKGIANPTHGSGGGAGKQTPGKK
jgi:hypothetical protein